MEARKLLKATCVRDCFDGGAYERKILTDAGVSFNEEQGNLCRTYIHGMDKDPKDPDKPLMIDPNNPIAVHFRFEQDPCVQHQGFTFNTETLQYVRDNPGPTQKELDAQLASLQAEIRINDSLKAEIEIARLRGENEKLRMEREALKPKDVKEIKTGTK